MFPAQLRPRSKVTFGNGSVTSKSVRFVQISGSEERENRTRTTAYMIAIRGQWDYSVYLYNYGGNCSEVPEIPPSEPDSEQRWLQRRKLNVKRT